MICPVAIANKMSAFSGVRSVLLWRPHEALLSSRRGADDESTRSDHAGAGQEDQMVRRRGFIPVDAAIHTIRAQSMRKFSSYDRNCRKFSRYARQKFHLMPESA